MTTPPTAHGLEQAHQRLQHLYEISKLLTRFESVEKTVPEIIAVVGQTLPLRAAIFILGAGARPRSIVWQAQGAGAPLGAAAAHARRSYAYLAGAAAEASVVLADQPPEQLRQESPGEGPGNFILLPLALLSRPILGALQLEGADRMDEMDLVFVNSVVNQLAVAVDRQLAIEAREAAAEARSLNAEDRQIAAESDRVRAERKQLASQAEQALAERNRDFARADRDAAIRDRAAALRLQERYQALLDNIDHAFVWEADARTLHVSYVSARAETLLGYPRERWLEERGFWTSCVHPDDRVLLVQTFRKALSENKDQRHDHRFLTVDGRILWFHTGIHLARAKSETPRLQCVSLDITAEKEAEAEVRDQLAFTRAVAGSLEEGVLAVDLDRRVTFFNAAAAQLLGWEGEPRGALVPDVVRILRVDGTPVRADECPFTVAMRRGETLRSEQQLFSPPGRAAAFPVSYTAAPLRRNGHVYGSVLAFEDITERKLAEEALREAADRWRFTAESMPQKIFTARPDGDVDYFNRQWSRFTGLSFEQLNDWDWHFIHPDDLEETLCHWRHSIDSGDPFQLEHRFRRADGVYCWHLSRAHAMRSAEGTVGVWIGSSTDIDDQKRAEKEQRLLAEVGTIVSSSLDPRATLAAVARCVVPLFADICIIDEIGEAGAYRRLNVVFADDKQQRELADRVRRFAPVPGQRTPQAQVLEAGTALLFSEIIDPLREGLAPDEEQPNAALADGLKSMMVVPLRAHGRNFGALTFIASDSGQRYSARDMALAEEFARRVATAIDNARAYEQAERATHSREELLGVVSHDLRNPLGVILMSVDVMAAELADHKSQKQLTMIKRAADRMTSLIRDLLDFASIDAGKLMLEPRRLDVGPFVADTIEAAEPLMKGKSLHVVSELAADLPAIFADSDRLERVLANLLSNAIKFTPASGTITVRAQEVAGLVQFSVSDHGPGIPAEDVPRLFERFWQARSTARQGTGLGLSIVEGIVVAHGGRVWVESQIGQGTTFFFTVPLAPEEPA